MNAAGMEINALEKGIALFNEANTSRPMSPGKGSGSSNVMSRKSGSTRGSSWPPGLCFITRDGNAPARAPCWGKASR